MNTLIYEEFLQVDKNTKTPVEEWVKGIDTV